MTPSNRRPGGGGSDRIRGGRPAGPAGPAGPAQGQASGRGDTSATGPERDRRRLVDSDSERRPRGMERIADLLPNAARQYGLEDQLEQARTASAWLSVIEERIPAAAGSCRLVGLNQGVATIETGEPIVAQEVRLRSLELLAALRATARTPVRQLRVTTRHV